MNLQNGNETSASIRMINRPNVNLKTWYLSNGRQQQKWFQLIRNNRQEVRGFDRMELLLCRNLAESRSRSFYLILRLVSSHYVGYLID